MKYLLIAVGNLLISLASIAQSPSIYKVTNEVEFINAIGSDRTIQLTGDAIYLPRFGNEKFGKYYRFDEENDGFELVILGVTGLKIVGTNNAPTKILTEPKYGDVIVFENCSDIEILNIEAGHFPEVGFCSGGVFSFVDSKNIKIDSSILFGSGIEGINAKGVSNLRCEDVIIKGCSYGILTLNTCNDIVFKNCIFDDNREFDLINISDCTNISFVKCTIDHNETDCSHSDIESLQFSILNIMQSEEVVLTDCIIQNNIACQLSRDSNSYKLINCNLVNNYFRNGNNSQIVKNIQVVNLDVLSKVKIEESSISNDMNIPKVIKVFRMKKLPDGTYEIPCKVNNLNLNFIFDTGASDVSISSTEALFMLKNGYLLESDITGKERYLDANGNISEGTTIKIRKLEFEGLTLNNVDASIVHNLDAPLLLGQSAISRLGKIQIDPISGTLSIIE